MSEKIDSNNEGDVLDVIFIFIVSIWVFRNNNNENFEIFMETIFLDSKTNLCEMIKYHASL